MDGGHHNLLSSCNDPSAADEGDAEGKDEGDAEGKDEGNAGGKDASDAFTPWSIFGWEDMSLRWRFLSRTQSCSELYSRGLFTPPEAEVESKREAVGSPGLIDPVDVLKKLTLPIWPPAVP